MLPFTPRLRIALATAEEYAKSEQRRDVSCHDIINGIVSLNDCGVATSLLKQSGFQPGAILRVPQDKLNHEVTSYSLDALRALSAAMEDAVSRSYTLIGTEDMLIGILSPPSAEISGLFKQKDINIEELLADVRKQLSPGPKDP